jgi:sterol desaturase/sphingolipid hydroxylase (fatty acid hydroxylase superfamily)
MNHLYFLSTITITVLIIEMFYSGWKKSSINKILRFEKSTLTDLTAWLIETVNLFSFFSLLFSFGICYYLVGFIQKSTNFNIEIHNSTIQFIVIFFVSDFKGWVSHFIFHKSKSLWQLHSFHHSATNFNILTRQRGHFLEAEIRRFFDVIPFVIFGAPISSYLIIKVFTEGHQMILHSSINSEWGIIGKYILVSPASHRIHHSIDPKHFNKNFGGTFIFWDKLFGTFHPKENEIALGIPDNPFNKGYFRDIIFCQWLFIKHLFISLQEISYKIKKFSSNIFK